MCNFFPDPPKIDPPKPKAEVVKRDEAPTFGRGNKTLAANLASRAKRTGTSGFKVDLNTPEKSGLNIPLTA
mgnify:CR=1 FL=1|tara:strand:+ start:84 stop:296 length:213 start_codon:yes stop_codon:yes gene_type:complete